MPLIQTVTGPVEATALGTTSVHEHLFIDLGVWFDASPDPEAARIADLVVGPDTQAEVRANPFAVRDNLVLDSDEVAAAEVARFTSAGGRTIVDLTLDDIGRDPLRLRALSERNGVQVVMGCGHYIAGAHPRWVRDASVETLADELVRDLTVGVRDTGVRAGVIGEIGTSDPVQPAEARVLAAACRAQLATGAALFVHLDPWGRNGHAVLDLVEAEGVPLDRVALCHLDPSITERPTFIRSLAARGAWVSIDIWGDEDAYGGRGMPTDRRRAAAVHQALDEGWVGQLLVAQDVCLKTQLRAYGGRGYDHLLTGMPALLLGAGLPVAIIPQLLVDNPRRLLAGGRSTPGGPDDPGR
ncbi:MAG: phosphotriesterase-related protein [Chloroflexota bacterium]